MIEPYGFYILLLLMLTGVLFNIMAPFVSFIINGIGSIFTLV
jgi:hypothetical protein